jgi:hypothetical protein
MPNAQYSAPAWGQSPYSDLELPSGARIQVKRIDLQAIAAAELIDEFDKLSPVAEEKVVQPAKGKRPSDRKPKKPTKAQTEQSAMKDFFKQENIESLLNLMDRVLPQIVIQPAIRSVSSKSDAGKWVPINPADREEGVIYVDTIPLADQMHILAFGMEGMDMDGLKSFREQSESDVADVETEPVDPVPSE